jgi:hypothetical protein
MVENSEYCGVASKKTPKGRNKKAQGNALGTGNSEIMVKP